MTSTDTASQETTAVQAATPHAALAALISAQLEAEDDTSSAYRVLVSTARQYAQRMTGSPGFNARAFLDACEPDY